MDRIRVIIFEDNQDFVDSMSELIRSAEGIELVGVFHNCKNVVKNVQHLQPDVVLMDIDMPVENGLQGLRKLRQEGNEVNVLMLTVFDDNDRVFQSICFGEAYSGGAPMTPSVAKQVLKLFSQPFQNSVEMQSLTPREHDVLSLLVRGYSYKMAAGEMEIGIETLRYHIKNIYSKLHVNSKSEAVAKAIQNKLV